MLRPPLLCIEQDSWIEPSGFRLPTALRSTGPSGLRVPTPVFCRRRAHPADEGPPKRVRIAEAAGTGYLFQGGILGFQETADGIDPHVLNVGGGRQARLGSEQAREMTRAHSCPFGQASNVVILGRTGGHPALDFLQGRAPDGSADPTTAELHLAAATLEEHDEMGRDPTRELGAEILLHKSQREIEPGRDPGRRPQRAVEQADRIRLNDGFGISLGQSFRHGPVRRDPTAVQQARLAEEKGSTADRAVAPGVNRDPSEPIQQIGPNVQIPNSWRPGDQEGVEGGRRPLRRDEIHHQPASRRGDDRTGLRSDNGKVIDVAAALSVCLSENIKGPGDIEELDTGKGEDCDGAGCHAISVADDARLMAEIVVERRLMTATKLRSSMGRAAQRRSNMSIQSDAAIPNSALSRSITAFVRDTETELLFNHSSRVYQFGALAGLRRGLSFDRELLYAGAMFHDVGLMPDHSSAEERFEVDGANAARDFLKAHGVPEADVYTVWTAIALHTTPGIPVHMHPVVALVTAGVEMDVLGLTYPEYSEVEREAVVSAYPRTPDFKEDIIQAFYDGIRHKPETTFGNVKADVMADKDPSFRRGNFCSAIRASRWSGGAHAPGCGCGEHA